MEQAVQRVGVSSETTRISGEHGRVPDQGD
jgi:hypothetical protein